MLISKDYIQQQQKTKKNPLFSELSPPTNNPTLLSCSVFFCLEIDIYYIYIIYVRENGSRTTLNENGAKSAHISPSTLRLLVRRPLKELFLTYKHILYLSPLQKKRIAFITYGKRSPQKFKPNPWLLSTHHSSILPVSPCLSPLNLVVPHLCAPRDFRKSSQRFTTEIVLTHEVSLRTTRHQILGFSLHRDFYWCLT